MSNSCTFDRPNNFSPYIKSKLWYEIKNNFTLCWVSNTCENPSSTNYESIVVVKYKKTPCKEINFVTNCNREDYDVGYRYAEPLTKEEMSLYLFIQG